jgi:hypothetical protein
VGEELLASQKGEAESGSAEERRWEEEADELSSTRGSYVDGLDGFVVGSRVVV